MWRTRGRWRDEGETAARELSPSLRQEVVAGGRVVAMGTERVTGADSAEGPAWWTGQVDEQQIPMPEKCSVQG